MDYLALLKSPVFSGLTAADLRDVLDDTPHRIQCYDKDETIFLQMDTAERIGIVLEGPVQGQKTFPNGSMVNVSTRTPGDLIGPAAVFSRSHHYPCDVIASKPATIMMIRKEDFLSLLQKDMRILENFTTEISTATYMLQQRIELFSYSGIGQKAAFWLLLRHKQTARTIIPIPESVTKWALQMNVSRPSLHRELKKMESKGFIHVYTKQIELLDIDGLQEMLSDN